MQMTVRHQNFMLSLRKLMGWPPFKPANDCIAWSSGKPIDFETGLELGRLAQLLGKDFIYSSWASTKAAEPTSFSIAWREMLAVEVLDRVVPHAENDDAPVVLVSIRSDETFAIDQRGSLIRMSGKPKKLAVGRKLAMKRIKSMAAMLDDELLANNRFVAPGADWIAPEAPVETIVKFG